MGVIVKNGIWYCGGDGSGSGGGENEYKTLLSLEDGIITAPSSGTQYTQETVLQEFILQDDINNYDQILIKNHVGPHYWNNQANLINESILYPKLYDGSMFTLGEPSFDDVNYYILMQVSIDKNKLKVHFNVKNNFDYSKIEIFGVKFNGGVLGSSQKILAIDTLYSEEEKIVGGWIDGKPIYQKTYSNNGNALTLPIDISNLNIDKLVNWEAACSNTQEYGPIMWTISICSGIDGRSLYIQDNQIKTTGSYYRHFITIQFTKTTDEENSFTYDMIDSTENLTDEQLAALASETIAAAWPQ